MSPVLIAIDALLLDAVLALGASLFVAGVVGGLVTRHRPRSSVTRLKSGRASRMGGRHVR